MKNLMIITYLTLTFISCQDVYNPSSVEKMPTFGKENLALVRKFENMGLEDKRTAYSLLSKYDKQAFWIKHINNYKINKTLTTKQKELIDLLLSKLDPDMFEE